MRILLTTEYKMVWLNLAYNMVNHVTVMDKKINNTLTKTHLLGYKLRYHGLLLLAVRTQTESYLMVWGSNFVDTVKKLQDLSMNTGFQFLVQWVSIAHQM